MSSEAQPFVVPVVQGATMFREIAVLDSDRVAVDVSSTAKTIQIGEGINEVDVTVSQGDSDELIEIRADRDETLNWPIGDYPFRIWLDWGAAADIEDEVILRGIFRVEALL